MDMDLFIGIGAILFGILCLYIAIKGLITIFKTLKKNGNVIGIVFMIILVFGLPIVGLGIGAVYHAFIDDGSSLKEDEEILNEESE